VRLVTSKHREQRRWLSLFGLLFVLAPVMGLRDAAAEDDQADEYALKASFLHKFVYFVDWPDSADRDPQAPIAICILGRDPFGGTLDRIISDHHKGERPLQLYRVQHNEPLPNCQVLYVSSSERKSVPQILASLGSASILTVGDTDQFAAQGGVIQLFLEDGGVRFKINLMAASRVKLKISSKLLALAEIVPRGYHLTLETQKTAGTNPREKALPTIP
jgi:hypothetical protein